MINLALQICGKNISFSKHIIDLNLSNIKIPPPPLLFLFIAVINSITCLLKANGLLIPKLFGYTFIQKTNKQAKQQRTQYITKQFTLAFSMLYIIKMPVFPFVVVVVFTYIKLDFLARIVIIETINCYQHQHEFRAYMFVI